MTIQHATQLCQPRVFSLYQEKTDAQLTSHPSFGGLNRLVEPMGFEPTTPALPAQCSPTVVSFTAHIPTTTVSTPAYHTKSGQ